MSDQPIIQRPRFIVTVECRGWRFTSEPLTQVPAEICARDFKRANPDSNPILVERK